MKLVKTGSPSVNIFRKSMKLFLITHTLNFFLNVKRLRALESNAAGSNLEKKKSLLTQCVKSLLMMVQAGHASGVFVTSNTFVGFAGVVTCSIDCRQMWNDVAASEIN